MAFSDGRRSTFPLGFDCRGPSLTSSLAGGYLIYRAATGNCLLYQALGVSTSDKRAANGRYRRARRAAWNMR